MKKLALLFLLAATPALAQQATPAETAIQLNALIGQWAQSLTQQARTIEELQKQLTAAQARVKELEPKVEEKKK